MKIFVVGNAPPTRDLASLIDAADVVIRFNLAPFYGKLTGTKTTTMALVNTGPPGSRLLSKVGALANPGVAMATTIKLPVAVDRVAALRAAYPELANDLTEHSHLTVDPIWADKTISFVSADMHAALATKVGGPMPSTGMIILEELVMTRQPGVEIHLCGFAHNGWGGHPWKAEKALTEDYIAQGFVTRH